VFGAVSDREQLERELARLEDRELADGGSSQRSSIIDTITKVPVTCSPVQSVWVSMHASSSE
jgi:phosphoribosylcarboxyaminoimidazole (NCAIR) mutase